MKIFLATGNRKKIKEISAIFKDFDVELLSIQDGIEIPEVVEDGDTFVANSAKKALEIAKFLNMPARSPDIRFSISVKVLSFPRSVLFISLHSPIFEGTTFLNISKGSI